MYKLYITGLRHLGYILQACLLCPSGFAANMAVMVAIGSLAPMFSVGKRPTPEEKIAVFSDALNHASIVDGLKLAERHGGVKYFVYKHCDMSHLDALLYVHFFFYINISILLILTSFHIN